MNDRLIAEVRIRAGHRCEYCLMPQAAFKRRFHIEHIVPRQHGGATASDNLALACWNCNLKKGPNLSGIDPATTAIVSLFNPRIDRWAEHFRLTVLRRPDAAVIQVQIDGLTPTGRATVNVLDMNSAFRCILRQKLFEEGLITQPSD